MIKVGVIGVGQMGQHHARNYSSMRGVKLVAISDTNPEKKKIADEYGCKFYNSYVEMLKNEDIDAVSIVVPSSLHHEVSLEIINRGKHLLIEKPIAEKIEKAEEIIKAAREKNVKLMVGHIERFNPAIKRVKEIIGSGYIGEIVSIVSRRVGGYPKNLLENNVITDLAVHDIDIFNYFLGKEPVSVYCHNVKTSDSSRINSAEILIDYGSAGCISQVNWITPTKIRTISITGTLGHIEVNNITQEISIYQNNQSQIFKNFDDYVLKFGSPIIQKIEVNGREEPLRLELEAFINSITKNEEPPISGEDGLKALKIAIKALNGGDKNVYS